MKIIDLRSDTVTLPTPAMREAMFRAELGDDVFAEDPTIDRLEKMASGRVGKEASLFVPSGTMANLVCSLSHCARGEEVILGNQSHMFLNEAGGMSHVGGIHPHTIPNRPDGTMRLEDIENAIRGENVHFPRTRLICIENTHNRCHGSPLTPQYTADVVALARRRGLLVHLDGARVFNAAVALGVDVRELAKGTDSVSFCFSKGLSAPVGSVVCGSAEFIARARRNRKVLGGGMRQAGVLAAAGIIALDRMIDRLADDHTNARRLAEGIAQVPGLSIDASLIKTNILYFDLATDRIAPDKLLSGMDRRGIKFFQTSPSRFRMVTHYGITSEDIDATLNALSELLKKSS